MNLLRRALISSISLPFILINNWWKNNYKTLICYSCTLQVPGATVTTPEETKQPAVALTEQERCTNRPAIWRNKVSVLQPAKTTLGVPSSALSRITKGSWEGCTVTKGTDTFWGRSWTKKWSCGRRKNKNWGKIGLHHDYLYIFCLRLIRIVMSILKDLLILVS